MKHIAPHRIAAGMETTDVMLKKAALLLLAQSQHNNKTSLVHLQVLQRNMTPIAVPTEMLQQSLGLKQHMRRVSSVQPRANLWHGAKEMSAAHAVKKKKNHVQITACGIGRTI